MTFFQDVPRNGITKVNDDVLTWTTYPNDCHTHGHGTLNGNQSGTW